MDREHAPSAMSSSSDSFRPAVAPRPLRMLIADDDRDSVMLLITLLDTEGHEARGIHDGQKVLPAVLAFDPDVVILDIHMPGLSGWEACRAIRDKCGDARPLLIGVSAVPKKAQTPRSARATTGRPAKSREAGRASSSEPCATPARPSP